MNPFSVAALIALAAATAAAQDPAKVSPKDYKVEIDNTWVRVLRVKQGPHATAPLHQHPPSVMVYLTDVDQRITGADGKAREVTHKAGEVAYMDAAKHAEENLSDQPLETVVIELKSGAPKSRPIELDPVTLDPEHHPVPLENDRVRVLRTILEPHLKSPMHQHPHYVVVYLTELHTTMTLGDGRVVDNPRRPGEIAWRDALQHVTENIGEHTAVEIQVEIK
jgi:quercetin dioxygenase-like cupin family protein